MPYHTRKAGAVVPNYAWEELANAIIIMAVRDYTCLLRGEPVPYPGLAVSKQECEEFFSSSYCAQLTNVSGEYLIQCCRRRARNEPIY